MTKAIGALFIACAAALAGGAVAATFTVTKIADTNDGSCDADCSLREAIVAANAAAGPDTVIVPAGTYVLTLPDSNENLSANGDLDITGELTITGAGAATTVIDGNDTTRVIHILGSSPVSIADVTISNGNVTGFGGGIHNEGSGTLTLSGVVVTSNNATLFGGGINNNADGGVSLQNSTVSNNTAGLFGGGINNNVNGSVSLLGSTVSGNTALGFGGGGINNNSGGTATVTLSTISSNTAGNGAGINNNNIGTLTVDRSTIAQNTATGSIGGGGILNNSSGTTSITASTISGNTGAGFGGGGIDNNSGGLVQLTNSTVSGNSTTGSNGGGGIYNNNTSGSVSLLNVTITGNASTNGGRNLHINGSGGTGSFGLRNTIVANPTSGFNCSGTFVSQGNNLASDASCGLAAVGDLSSTNPLLGPLASNGGPTQTHGLLAGSPANAVGAPAVDQRGVARPIGAGFDIGSFEGTLAGALPTLSINSLTANEGNAGTTTFTFTVTLLAPSAATVTVDFATADGTAAAGTDYTATSGTLTFAPGTTTQMVSVSVIGDTTNEVNETFFVNLSNASNATLAAAQGTGTITNDDAVAPPPPSQPPADIPTLSEWMLTLLATVLSVLAYTRLRRRGMR